MRWQEIERDKKKRGRFPTEAGQLSLAISTLSSLYPAGGRSVWLGGKKARKTTAKQGRTKQSDRVELSFATIQYDTVR